MAYHLTDDAINVPPSIPVTARLVLIKLAQYADRNTGLAWPSKETIAAELGISRSSVFAAVKLLKQVGYLQEDSKLFISDGEWVWKYKVCPPHQERKRRSKPVQNLDSPRPKSGRKQVIGTSHPSSTQSTSLQAGKQAAPTPTAEPTEPLANCAQQSLRSLAGEPTALAQSATPTKPPFKYCRPVSNIYYCEDQQPGVAAAC